jgi:hypothetical protein
LAAKTAVAAKMKRIEPAARRRIRDLMAMILPYLPSGTTYATPCCAKVYNTRRD